MNSAIFSYLKKNITTDPQSVDKLLISAFIVKMRLPVKKNKLLVSYTIRENDKDQFAKLQLFLAALDKYAITLNIESLIELFEFVISPEDRIVTGAVYTPKAIREYILQSCFSKITITDTTRIADISCGCGGFLFSAARQIKQATNRSFQQIFSENIWGLDIQDYAIDRSKLLLSVLALSEGEDVERFDFRIFKGNALSFNWRRKIDSFEGFDIIVGNPPYVCARNIPEESRALLHKWEVSKTGHPDLYIPFFQIALVNLTANGVLGYITMNTFFKSVNGRALRAYFTTCKYYFDLIDYNNIQVFRSRSTYTCICTIQKSVAGTGINYYKAKSATDFPSKNNDFLSISYEHLSAFKGWNLSKEYMLVNQIEKVGMPFFKQYKTRTGIATLRNAVYIFSPVEENSRYYYVQFKQTLYPIEKAVCKEIVNPNLLTTQHSLRNIREKIIFPYTITDTEVVSIAESEMRGQYPNAYAYLMLHKKDLATRDKNKAGLLTPWYAYGRNQSLEKLKHKLFFPHITPKTPNYVIDSDENLLFYNGLAVIGQTRNELIILKKLLSSRLFWFYIRHTSKPYGSDYFSLSRNYIKYFGIYQFSEEDKMYIVGENNSQKLDLFFEQKYNIQL